MMLSTKNQLTELETLTIIIEMFQVIVVLHGGENYRFVMIEDNGLVSSYSPRLSAGDHMIMVMVCL